MLELIDCDHLIKGQMYYTIHNLSKQKEILIFDGYSFFKYPDRDDSFQIHLRMNTFYRYINKEEYYAKLKEKYDNKCLNIVLKNLVDGTFEWL
jgi:hypothetical protein